MFDGRFQKIANVQIVAFNAKKKILVNTSVMESKNGKQKKKLQKIAWNVGNKGDYMKEKYSTTTDIEIYLDNVDKSGNLIDDVAFRRLQYSDRTQLSSMLVALYEEYGFKKIITSIKLPKAILKKYNVEFDETMKR